MSRRYFAYRRLTARQRAGAKDWASCRSRTRVATRCANPTPRKKFGRDRGLDRPRRQENVRGRRASTRGCRYIQSLRRLCTDGAVLPGGLPVAGRQTRRCLRVLRRRYQGRGTAPVLLERRQSGNGRTRTAMYTDGIEQLHGTADARHIRVRAETALAAFTTPSSGGWIMFGKHPN
jgi:hypothetical protein